MDVITQLRSLWMIILLILGADLHLLMVKTPVLLLDTISQYFL
jgi:hypothetical protein